MSEDKRASWHRPSGPRTALLGGFGAVLILMAFICFDSLDTLGTFDTRNTQIRQDFLYSEGILERVRTNLYESGNIISEYILIQLDPNEEKALRTSLQSIHDDTIATLKARIQSLPSEKRGAFQHLNAELETYWSKLDTIAAQRTDEKNKPHHPILRRVLLAQNTEILSITKDISEVNARDLKETEQREAEVFGHFRGRLLMAATIAFCLGLILAAGTILYTARLEESVEEKYHESQKVQHELQALSKRLVEAEERERRAISRELHDEVGQSLSAMLVDVESLMEASGNEGVLRQGLQRIKTLAENCLNEVRNMALLLRPPMLDDLGLVAAIDWQARDVSKRTGLLVDLVEENVSEDLPEAHKTCAYRIVQEALNNCSKHAGAKSVRIVLRQETNDLRISVEDDGKGFDSRRVQGLGLVGMKERVTQLGGRLNVASEPGRGTQIQANLPVPTGSADEEN